MVKYLKICFESSLSNTLNQKPLSRIFMSVTLLENYLQSYYKVLNFYLNVLYVNTAEYTHFLKKENLFFYRPRPTILLQINLWISPLKR